MDGETTAEIMDATGEVLCEYGYADLTVGRIAESASMTTAAIHYHFDTKAALLNAYLDTLADRFERRLACEAEDPRERLETFLDVVFSPSGSDGNFPTALMELKAQAPYEERFRERFRELDERLRSVLASIVRDGVEAGQFESADPDAVARHIATLIDGGHVHVVALGEAPGATREVVERYLRTELGWAPGVAT